MTTGPPFAIGDIVVLKTGHSPQEVWDIRRSRPRGEFYEMRCMYLSAKNSSYGDFYETASRWRRASDYRLFEPHKTDKEVEIPMPKLYQTNGDEPRYGTFLTKDSRGRMVLEMKPEGNVESFEPKQLEEVLPYTVELAQLMPNSGETGRTMNVLAEQGQVQKDDVLLELVSGLMWRVKKLD